MIENRTDFLCEKKKNENNKIKKEENKLVIYTVL